jgi:hypothetical protein
MCHYYTYVFVSIIKINLYWCNAVIPCYLLKGKKVKVTLEPATNTQTGSRGIALLLP